MSSIIAGLSFFLEELASEHVSNLAQNYFNIDAKPFVPNTSKPNNNATLSSVTDLDLGFAQSSLQASVSGKSTEESKEQTLLDKKRQIS